MIRVEERGGRLYVYEARTELERLLALAEGFHESVERPESRLSVLQTISSLTAILGLGGAVLTWFAFDDSKHVSSVAIIMMTMAYVLVTANYTTRLAKRRDRDRRVLLNLVDLLREAESAFLNTRQWSALDRAQFQIRVHLRPNGPQDCRHHVLGLRALDPVFSSLG